jgi:hypothetical protein
MAEPSTWRGARLVPRATPTVVHRIGSGPSPRVVRARWATAGTLALVVGAVAAATFTTGGPPSGAARGPDAAATTPTGPGTTAAPASPAPTASASGTPVAATAATTSSTAPTSASEARADAPPRAAVGAGATPSTHVANRFVALLPAERLQLWERLAHCESRGDWSIASGNGYYGGLQFSLESWHGVGGVGRPDGAAWSEQVMRAELLLAEQGWEAWPVCARALGLLE